MNLPEIEQTWKAYLASDKCPPLLGLAPLSEMDRGEIRDRVHSYVANHAASQRLDGLMDLLHRYPATMAVYLARVAADAYDANNFWSNFSTQLSLTEIPGNRREQFASRFRRVCHALMSAFVEPETGSRQWVGQFLFQAGLPLCHCERFVRAMRAVAQQIGLPDPDDEEAGEDFRLAMVERTEIKQTPVIATALSAASGIHLVQVALRVVREEDYSGINPGLGEKLKTEFANVTARSSMTVLHSPYLRLGEDCTMLELVGPIQPEAAIGVGGLAWIVNGQRFRIGNRDELVLPLMTSAPVVAELQGLRGGRTLRREFSPAPERSESQFLLFSCADRKQKRVAAEAQSCALPCGEYWIVHRASDALDTTETVFLWEGGQRATSLLKVRPGTIATLRTGLDESICEFKPAIMPFLEFDGASLFTDDGERVHFGWSSLPTVWIPKDDSEAEWKLRVDFNGVVKEWRLRGEPSKAIGDLLPCCVDSADCFGQLSPALYEVRFEVIRRARRQAMQTVLFWNDLESAEEGIFRFTAAPTNLQRSQCLGFDFTDVSAQHRRDHAREHSLVFSIDGHSKTLRWSQPGVFLESTLKHSGVPSAPIAHRLGESFSAETSSSRFLRVWIVPATDAELRVNGSTIQRFDSRSGQTRVEISLAHLATLFAEGGEMVLVRGGLSLTIARFRRPLVPRIFEYTADENHEGLLFQFAEPVRWVRPRWRELISGRVIDFDGKRFSTSGHCLFAGQDLPEFECSNLAKDCAHEATLHRVALDVPKAGWPEGIWLGELEVRRDDKSEWEPLRDEQRGRFPLIVLRPPNEGCGDYLRLLSECSERVQ